MLDLFADRPFDGARVALVEQADTLGEEAMRSIAGEFGPADTVFLLTPRDPANSARVRVFASGRESAVASHPLLGAAAMLGLTRAPELVARSGVVVALETASSLICCDVLRGKSEDSARVEFVGPILPQRMRAAPDAAILAAALSLEPQDIGFLSHAPSVYSAGLECVFVPLRGRAVLDRAARASPAFERALGEAAGAYLYAIDEASGDGVVHARMLPNGPGLAEEPATGAAALAFAGVALDYEAPGEGEHIVTIEQGRLMGRPSLLHLRVRIEADRLVSACLGGAAARVSEGELFC